MSSEIQGFSEVDLLSAQFGDDGRIGVDRREDKETIEKTDRAAPEIISDTPRSTASDLDGKLIEPIAAETTKCNVPMSSGKPFMEIPYCL